MSKTFGVAAMLATLCIASGGAWLWRLGHRASTVVRRESTTDQVDTAGLRRQILDLEARLGRLEIGALALASKCALAGSAGEKEEQEQKTAPQAVSPALEERGRLDSTFRAEPVDAALTAVAEAVEAKVRAVLPRGSTLGQIECRSSSCRVETTHPSMRSYDEFLETVQKGSEQWLPSPAFAPVVEPDDGTGEITAIAYLNRN